MLEIKKLCTATILVSISQLSAAAIVNNGLTGNTDYDGWDALGLIPGYGLSDVGSGWPAPLGSMEAGSADATLDRISGGHYSSGVSLYSFSTNSVLSVADTTAVSGIETVVFSIETWLAGDETTGPLALPTLPTLSYGGGSQLLTADYSFLSAGANTVSFGGDDLDTVIYTYQWDLSGIGVTSFNIDWEHQVHSGVVGLQLEQSDNFSVANAQVVPVPAAFWMFGSACLGFSATKRMASTKNLG